MDAPGVALIFRKFLSGCALVCLFGLMLHPALGLAQLAGAQPAPCGAKPSFDAGPFVAEFLLTLSEGRRTEAFGPCFYRQVEPDGVTFAVPPLFSRTKLTATDSEEIDFAYPVLTYDRFGKEYRWQLFQLLSFSGGADQSETAAHKFTLFPFYFQQRSPAPAQNYTALFPVIGRLESRMFRSEIEFALWPLYLKTIRRASASSLPDDVWFKKVSQKGSIVTIEGEARNFESINAFYGNLQSRTRWFKKINYPGAKRGSTGSFDFTISFELQNAV